MVDQESVRPLAKSAAATAKDAPTPGYEIVARAITGDDPPAWLVIFLKMWGPCLAVDRGVAAVKLPTRAHMRKTLEGVRAAAALILSALDDGETRGFPDAASPGAIPDRLAIYRLMSDLVRRGSGAQDPKVCVKVGRAEASSRIGALRPDRDRSLPVAAVRKRRPRWPQSPASSVTASLRAVMARRLPKSMPPISSSHGLELQSRREEALANETHLVLDLTLLPARCRRAGDGLHQMMGAHLQEPPIILPVLADEDRQPGWAR
jgi:hypothetical protein